MAVGGDVSSAAGDTGAVASVAIITPPHRSSSAAISAAGIGRAKR